MLFFKHRICCMLILGCVGCGGSNSTERTDTEASPSVESRETLLTVRQGFKTKLWRNVSESDPPEEPPEGMFDLVRYPGPMGDMSAYVTPTFGDGKRHPAIIWLTGGFSNGIGSSSWAPYPADNDQSAQQYRKEGMVMMFPSLRGGNTNPGVNESYFGEVDDVVAATKWLKQLDYVDPDRVYLGGHSTGGTLALLVAEACDEYRGVVSFGPVDDVLGYGPPNVNFDATVPMEAKLRAPIHWLHCITTPTYVIEGTEGRSNADSLIQMAKSTNNPKITFKLAEGHDHFTLLSTYNRMIAKQLVDDKAEEFRLSFEE